ncbi:MAG: peptide chain release factor 1 [Proteobacteria bacterium]|nr:peptide chain release factor 1 [Pseudomonadota bacterium]
MPNYLDRIQDAATRARELEEQLLDPDVAKQPGAYEKLAKELGGLRPLVETGGRYRTVLTELEDARAMAEDSDPELAELARGEVERLESERGELEGQLAGLLAPRDPLDEKDVILEIRAGTGGEEAALFAADLYRMYLRYAELQGWKVEPMSSSEMGSGGLKEVVAGVAGKDVFRRLKYERGVHRVQRVPTTESQGRIHTSTVTVAVLPEAEEVDVAIDPNDLRVDVYRSSGPGGQSVNTTDSAVRLTHVPTGVVVQYQDEKSQHKNKAKAMKVLRARLLEHEQERAASERASERRAQVGSGERSEKIRTYNFPQSRVTDHRAGVTLHKLDQVLEGELDELVDAVHKSVTAAGDPDRDVP